MPLSVALRKKIALTAKQAGAGSIDLATCLWEARNPPSSSTRGPAKYDELMEASGLSRRAAIYLVKVWGRFGHLGIEKERLEAVGWTKLSIIDELCEPGEEMKALKLAETYTAKELPAALKGGKPRKKHVVTLRLSHNDWIDFREALIEHGAKPAKNKVGLAGKETALMKALGLK